MLFHNSRVYSSRGFTLIEVLLVIAILVILAAVVIVAINPEKQFTDAHNAQRKSDVYLIMNALHQYSLDHDGVFPEIITTGQLEICKTDAQSCVGKYDLSILTDDQKYLVAMPRDPLCSSSEDESCSETGTGYLLAKTESGRMWLLSDFGVGTTIELIK